MANCVMCNKSVTGYYDYEGAKIPVCFEHYEDGTFANYLAAKQSAQPTPPTACEFCGHVQSKTNDGLRNLANTAGN